MEPDGEECDEEHWHDGRTAVSDSCLFYLFADRLIPTERPLSYALGEIAVPVPASNRLVPLGNLERHLLTVAMLSLESLGAITIDYQARDAPRGLRLRRQPGAVPGPGLEGLLLSLLDGGEEISLWKLVMFKWAAQGGLPLNATIAEAQIEAMRAACIARPDTPVIIPGFLGHHTFPAVRTDAARLDELEPDFAILSARWTHACSEGVRIRRFLRETNQALYNARPAGGVRRNW